jgi:hypothetical protein
MPDPLTENRGNEKILGESLSDSESFDEIQRIERAGRIIVIVNVDRDALASAAFRLKHDLGKAVRWNAPVVRETSPDDLRHRLKQDLLEARVDREGRTRSAVEIFDAWLSAQGALFQSDPELGAQLARISAAVDVLRSRLSRLSELPWDELVALDDASLVISEESRALWRDAMSGPAEGVEP